MWDENEYFSDSEVVQYCAGCGEELYQGDIVYYDSDNEEFFCCEECMIKYYRIERVEL